MFTKRSPSMWKARKFHLQRARGKKEGGEDLSLKRGRGQILAEEDEI